MHKILLGFLVFLVSCSQIEANVINIAGSDTILELVQSQAESYYAISGQPVNVTGGGSGVGINLVQGRTIDIANSSRELSDKEISPELVEIVIAEDLISVVVHKDNPISHLDKNTLKKIFTGKITNWKELGWKDMKISLYGRQSSSGTFQYFQKMILDKQNFSVMVKEMTGNAQMIRSLEVDPAGIAYVAFGYYEHKKNKLNLVAVNGVYPSLKRREDYILSRGVYQIYNKNSPKIKEIQSWFDYILGIEGQKIALSMGFLPLSEKAEKKMKQVIGIIYNERKAEKI